mmetsp:Transcript_56320/g.127098  ORF Transcript_56320/g.127098 Transcript_56320/m.127098 type:complete len:326 (-) Transcript_56320:13-990(-)
MSTSRTQRLRSGGGCERLAGHVGSARDVRVRLVRELDELLLEVSALVCEHSHGSNVAGAINVVGRAEHRVDALDGLLVAGRFGLVRPDDVLEAVRLQEPCGDVGAESVDHGYSGGGPIAVRTLRVGPEEINHQGRLHGVGLHDPVHGLDLRQRDLSVALEDAGGLIGGLREPVLPQALLRARDASVHDEGLVLQDVREGEVPEALAEKLHHLLLVLDLHLSGKAVLIVGHLGLVVPAVEVHGAGILQLQGVDAHEDLHRPNSTVHKVAVEEDRVLSAWKPGHRFEHVGEVKELPVQVANHGDLAALGHGHPLQGLLGLQEVEHVQ